MKKLIFILSSLVVCAVLIALPLRNEQILGSEDSLLVELAPVDPRSLMQGDYMTLAFALERDQKAPEHNAKGSFVLKKDKNGKAQFVRFYEGETLAANERLLHYRLKHNRAEIYPRTYFFQEGHAKAYEAARYGIFSYSDASTYLLTGLANENAHKIIVNPAP